MQRARDSPRDGEQVEITCPALEVVPLGSVRLFDGAQGPGLRGSNQPTLQSSERPCASMPKPDVVGHLGPSERGCYRPPSFPRKRKEFQ